jgi:dihydroorotate dehydrogenase (fumarate)
MDLKTKYLGLELAHPLMAGSSPLATDLDKVRRLEDAGAAAIVMPSLFEEQIRMEQDAALAHEDAHAESSAEATTYFPRPEGYRLGPDDYLELLAKVKAAVKVPVIGSLNGVTQGGWLSYAKQMQQAGADALELNIYFVPTDPAVSGDQVEGTAVEMVREIRKSVTIPVAVKLASFYSSLPHFAQRLEAAGADGLVLFNRFYQPDIDVAELEVKRTLVLSTSAELNLRLRWLAILSGRVRASLAVSGGVHTPVDVVKAVMAGADGVQVVSALLQKGPAHLRQLRDGLSKWLEENEYESLAQMRGSMNLTKSPDATAYERANYIQILQGWKA